MNHEKQEQYNEYLYSAILELKNIDECRAFFETLCTTQEIRSFAQRIQVAKMLHDGCVYSRIVHETGASTATISRVNRSMGAGQNGYESIFERMQESE
ncbi:MAG: TrpR-like protein, YerC/YecD [Clostridia bacterium]|nr:TrpR-like protein, YerC/YecD [Clostridia bacterium]